MFSTIYSHFYVFMYFIDMIGQNIYFMLKKDATNHISGVHNKYIKVIAHIIF